MKVVGISFSQLLQLRSVQKSFCTLVCGSWHVKHLNEWLELLAQSSSHSFVLFRLIVEVNSEAEEYCINSLELRSLPSLVFFSKGILQYTINISSGLIYSADFAQCLNSEYSHDELLAYKAYNTAVNLLSTELCSTALSNSIGHLFLSGDRSSVGKSSMCLAILVSLLRKGVPPSALAYIKPVTQCEADQPVTVFCNRVGISHRGIGPVVFYKGFTRAYLNGETAPAESLLDEAQAAVFEIAQGKLFTLVDGVGYPSVGSICNLSNADVAKRLNAPVLLVGKSGVGDAVDSYNLNSAFFALKGVRVLGGVFNKLPLDGYYSLDNCKEAVNMYFQQFRPQEMPYGFVPTIEAKPSGDSILHNNDVISTDSMEVSSPVDTSVNTAGHTADNAARAPIAFTAFETQLSDALLAHVDLDRLMHDVWMYEIMKHAEDTSDQFYHYSNNVAMDQTPESLTSTYVLLAQQLAAANKLLESSRAVAGVNANTTYNRQFSSGSQNNTIGASPTATRFLPNTQSYSQLSTQLLPLQPMSFVAPTTPSLLPAVPSLIGIDTTTKPTTAGHKRSREEVEQAARKQGATGG